MDTGLRKQKHLLTSVSEKLISENIFNNLVDEVHARCPLVHQILTALVVEKLAVQSNSTKTAGFKIKQALHHLSFLMNIRNQKWHNDFPFIFAMSALSYGAGKMFITFLNNLDLTVSWKTL